MVVGDRMQAGPEAFIGTILGAYQCDQVLGVGGMGAVYLAHRIDDPHVQVAIKILLPAWQSSPTDRHKFRQRFIREAEVLGQLQHPHILRVLATGEKGEISYLIMPFAAAGSLAQWLGSLSAPLPLATVLTLLMQLAGAIDYAHAQGIIHRDLKPANILLTAPGNLLLADFGIMYQTGEDRTKLTLSGQVIGTPAYLAPEQAQGKEVTPAVDLYSLGIIAYELITGRPPFSTGSPIEVMVAQVSEPPPAPRTLRPDLPPAAEMVLLRMLAKDPAQRWPSAAAFVAALGEAIDAPTVKPTVLPSAPLATTLPPLPTPTLASAGDVYVPLAPSAPLATTLPPRPTPTLASAGGFQVPIRAAQRTTRWRFIGVLALTLLMILVASGVLLVAHPWQGGATLALTPGTATATSSLFTVNTQPSGNTFPATSASSPMPTLTVATGASTPQPTVPTIAFYPTSTPLPVRPTATFSQPPTATAIPAYNPNVAFSSQVPPPCVDNNTQGLAMYHCNANNMQMVLPVYSSSIYTMWGPPGYSGNLAQHFAITQQAFSFGTNTCYDMGVAVGTIPNVDYLDVNICSNNTWQWKFGKYNSNVITTLLNGSVNTGATVTMGLECNRGVISMLLNGATVTSYNASAVSTTCAYVTGLLSFLVNTATPSIFLDNFLYQPLP